MIEGSNRISCWEVGGGYWFAGEVVRARRQDFRSGTARALRPGEGQLAEAR